MHAHTRAFLNVAKYASFNMPVLISASYNCELLILVVSSTRRAIIFVIENFLCKRSLRNSCFLELVITTIQDGHPNKAVKKQLRIIRWGDVYLPDEESLSNSIDTNMKHMKTVMFTIHENTFKLVQPSAQSMEGIKNYKVFKITISLLLQIMNEGTQAGIKWQSCKRLC